MDELLFSLAYVIGDNFDNIDEKLRRKLFLEIPVEIKSIYYALLKDLTSELSNLLLIYPKSLAWNSISVLDNLIELINRYYNMFKKVFD